MRLDRIEVGHRLLQFAVSPPILRMSVLPVTKQLVGDPQLLESFRSFLSYCRQP
jgi:hypothetical protein